MIQNILNFYLEKDICDRTFTFSIRIVKLCQFLDDKPGVARTLAQQLLRSGTSIGANVEEAQAAQSKADFIGKMMIALKESRETRYWLRLLVASEIVPQEKISQLQTEAEELTRILGAIVISTKDSN
ncbi:four helix bundle protein [Chlorogloeopsis fritschii PCC 9212]|uniref:Four helix bundle protein n=1 Tax=Chlorogloeopsis fritschii PCC 6912 TaxID=211165 RepID=A0A3S0ZQV5_CHLFR|nr:four helix bundle protein [Chlorogloeopsis fritschii]RUR77811.1 hypothetical protein PCC6912_36920 [Chlorogloeopsis fritschii PCC 6912]